MRLRLTPRAVADLGEIADYLLERNPAAAAKVRDAILDALNILTLFPEAGRRQSVDGVRKLVTRKYRYLFIISSTPKMTSWWFSQSATLRGGAATPISKQQ